MQRIHIEYKSAEEPRGVRPLSSVLKTLALLDVLAEARRSVRLAELARSIGAERSTVYQRLVTLVAAGWVEQLEDGSFRLTMRPARLAHAALEQTNLGGRAVPVLQELVNETGETASLAALDGDEVRIVQRVESAGILRAELKVGARLGLDGTASGRVLAAYCDAAQLARWREAGIALPDDGILAQVRREKFVLSDGRTQGIIACAAPVFEAGGRCIAALSLVGPLPRFQAEAARAALCAAAERITQLVRGQMI